MTDGDEIVAHSAAGTLPQLFVERVRGHLRDEEGKAFRAALVDLHNAGVVDVLEPARAISTSDVSQHEFFLVQSVYVDIIPELEDAVAPMLAAVKALVARAGNDGTSGMPNGAFRTWLHAGDRARATIALIDPASPEDTAYVFLALMALGKTEPGAALDEAIAFLASRDVPARLGAARAIGNLSLDTSEARLRSLDALEAAHHSANDEDLRGQIVVAAAEIARKGPREEAAALRLIDVVAKDASDQVIHHAISALMFDAGDLPTAVVAALTSIAHQIRVANKGTLERLDDAAARLLHHGKVAEALELIVPILSEHEELCSLEQLDGFAHGLLQLDRERVAHIIVEWLLSLERNLGAAVQGLVGYHHGDPLLLDLDATVLALSEDDTILLAYRTIGYLFIHPITAASIILPLVPTGSARAREEIEKILFEPLLINYSGELAGWLKVKEAESSDPALPTIKSLLARLDAYLGGLRSVGPISELRPSERERLIEGYRQQELMRQVQREAQKRSVLMSIVSRSVLLYGSRSISYFEDPSGKGLRNEMKLHSFSHSFEAPRLDIIEPFELDYTIRIFRAMRAAP